MSSTENKIALNGLILAGGKSTRMGRDKAVIEYNGLPQFLFLTQLLTNFVDQVFISCRKDQEDFFQSHALKTIADKEENKGPLGAIASAFDFNRECAWLVLASDLPLLDAEVLNELISQRDTSKMATSFISPFDGKPEPLIAIWEPHAFSSICQFQLNDITCPRKVLMNSDIHLVAPSQPGKLENVNRVEDAERLKLAMN